MINRVDEEIDPNHITVDELAALMVSWNPPQDCLGRQDGKLQDNLLNAEAQVLVAITLGCMIANPRCGSHGSPLIKNGKQVPIILSARNITTNPRLPVFLVRAKVQDVTDSDTPIIFVTKFKGKVTVTGWIKFGEIQSKNTKENHLDAASYSFRIEDLHHISALTI